MSEGAKIVEIILRQLDYDSQLSKKIIYYVSVHDNWVFGDNGPFYECKEMALFNDLDFLVGFRNKEMFLMRAKSMKMTPEEMYEDITKEEKLMNRPFCCEETKNIFEKFMKDLKKEIENEKGNVKK